MSNLSQGWNVSTLGEICSKPQYGWTSKAAHSGELRYVRTTDISNGKINWEKVPFCSKIPDDIKKYKIRKDDILVSRAGSVGVSYRIKRVPFDAVFASYLIRFKPTQNINPKYIEYYLKSDEYWKSISDFTAGIAIPNVNASKLSQLKIPLAPENEQCRIVAKLEKLLQKVDACTERLDKIPTILKRFRQSVLAAACSGRLTEDWRVKNPDVEPAIDHLKSLLKKRKRAANFDSHEIHNWTSTPVKSLYDSFGGGTPSKSRTEFWNGSIPWVSSGDVKTDKIEQGTYFITQEGLENSSASMCPEHSIIVVVRSGVLKHVLPVAIVQNPLTINQDIKCFDSTDTCLNYWLLLNLKAYQNEILKLNREGTTVQSVKYDTLKNFRINIPPPAEQHEIVQRVEALFKIADQIEERYNKARTYVDKLTQSTLVKAFRGELVPQDPTDEPASELLKRIKEEKAKTETKAKSTKRGRQSKAQT